MDGRGKPGHDVERLCLSSVMRGLDPRIHVLNERALVTVAILHRSRAEFHFFVLVQVLVSPAQAFVRSVP